MKKTRRFGSGRLLVESSTLSQPNSPHISLLINRHVQLGVSYIVSQD